jgi:hypothetical protein
MTLCYMDTDTRTYHDQYTIFYVRVLGYCIKSLPELNFNRGMSIR